jgi:hypothetical protein
LKLVDRGDFIGRQDDLQARGSFALGGGLQPLSVLAVHRLAPNKALLSLSEMIKNSELARQLIARVSLIVYGFCLFFWVPCLSSFYESAF